LGYFLARLKPCPFKTALIFSAKEFKLA